MSDAANVMLCVANEGIGDIRYLIERDKFVFVQYQKF